MKSALFHLFKTVWETEKILTEWTKTTLLQLYKGKMDFRDLNNMRNLHIKEDVPKFFGHIVVNQVKEILKNQMTPFQIGTKKGHRPQENIFIMMSMMKLNQTMKKPTIVQLYDISKFFDKENLPDIMNELHGVGLKGKLYRILYKLNEKRIIKVNTAVGSTDEEEVAEGVGQGSLEGAVISATGLGRGVNSFFKSSQWEAFYGSVRLQPSLYQDDIGRMVSNLLAAQAGNTFLSTMMESKLLNFNVLKSVFLVVGNCEETEKIKEQVTEKPLMLSGKIMKNVVQYDYLGMVVHEGGAGASAAATVNKRVGRVKQLIFEIKAVLEDCRLETVGGLISGLDLWEMMVLPYLYFSSECWTDISKETMKKLTDLHLLFYRSLLASGRGAPIGGFVLVLGAAFT